MRKKLKNRLRTHRPVPKEKRKIRSRSIHIYQMWKNWRSRTLFLTSMLALIVGTFFGLTTLYIFNEEDKTTNTISYTNHTEVSGEEEHTERYNVQPLSFYVIQVGMFADHRNAEREQERLQKEKINSFVWERDEHYYVLLSLHPTEKSAQKRIDSFQEEEFFVKQWETIDGEIKSSEQEQAWFLTFHDTFENALTHFEEREKIEIALWEEVLEEKDGLRDSLKETQTELAALFDERENEDAATLLLQIAYTYDRMTEALK